MNGWMGKSIWIDLSSKEIEVKETEEKIRNDFLGGRGFGSYLLLEGMKKNISPFSEDNLVILATGPFTGAIAPTPGRFSASTKSPLTGTITDSNCGGNLGPEFKSTGYDYIIIRGKAKKPVYLSIFNDEIKLNEAGDLWGKKVTETMEALKKKHGEKVKILTIGPAGENRVRFASVMTGHSALGRGGIGSVMGSKNLKAIVVIGDRKIKYADKERVKFVNKEIIRNINQHPITSRALPQFGTSVLMNVINEVGILPKNNFQNSDVMEEVEYVSGEAISEKILEKKTGCWGCMIRCKRDTSINGESGEGPEYETNWALGPNCGNYDLVSITRANYLCNEYGLDTISAGGTIACAMEMSEKGILDWGLKFGDSDRMPELVREIALRERIGDELAEGSKRLAESYNAGEFAMHSKGQELPAYDPRGAKGEGLAYVASNRGGCHLRGGYMIGTEILGAPEFIDRFLITGKAALLMEEMDTGAVYDSLTICRFVHYAVSNEMIARLLSAIIGKKIDTEKILKIGERIVNIEKIFNLREGFTRKDDTLPKRLLEEPLTSGPAKGEIMELDIMLDEYYETRGWDREGIPTKEKLEELRLGDHYGEI